MTHECGSLLRIEVASSRMDLTQLECHYLIQAIFLSTYRHQRSYLLWSLLRYRDPQLLTQSLQSPL